MSAKVIAVINQKGGVGKTTTCANLAGFWAQQGMKVLLVDHESQHSLTNSFYGIHGTGQLDPHRTIAALYDETCDPDPNSLIADTPFENLFLVPSSDALKPFNLANPQESGHLQIALREFIQEIRDDFGLILIDNPGNLQLLSWASLSAADFAFAVTQPEDYGAQGMIAVRAVVDDVLRSTNPHLRFLGFVINMLDRRLSIHKAYEQMLRREYEDRVCQTSLPLAVDFKEAVAIRHPISQYKPKSRAAAAIEELAVELIDRMADLYTRPPQFQNVAIGQAKAELQSEAV